MPAYTDLSGLLSNALLIAVAVLQLPRIRHLPRRLLAGLSAIIFLLSLLPLGGLPVVAYVRGIVGDLSITSVVLMLIVLLQPYQTWFDEKQRHHLSLMVVLAALCLYPLALGASLYDPYRLGYSDTLFVATILLFAIAALLIGESLLTLCLTLGTLAWSLGWYESSNLWDYLIDPLVSVYALLTLRPYRIFPALIRRVRRSSL